MTSMAGHRPGPVLVSLLIVVLLLGACKTSQRSKTAESPIGPTGLTVSQIQSELMSYADNMADFVAQGADEIVDSSTDPLVRRDATSFKLQTIRGAYTIAAGPNPIVGVIDMAVMVTLSRQAAEMYDKRHLGDHGEPLIEALDNAQERVWKLAAKVLTSSPGPNGEPGQIEELKTLIA